MNKFKIIGLYVAIATRKITDPPPGMRPWKRPERPHRFHALTLPEILPTWRDGTNPYRAALWRRGDAAGPDRPGAGIAHDIGAGWRHRYRGSRHGCLGPRRIC